MHYYEITRRLIGMDGFCIKKDCTFAALTKSWSQ